MRYYFRFYYLIPTREVIHKFKERFSTIVSVNGESHIYTDDKGRELLLESERRKSTNIKSSLSEMNEFDNILFRCWQMGWLKQYE